MSHFAILQKRAFLGGLVSAAIDCVVPGEYVQAADAARAITPAAHYRLHRACNHNDDRPSLSRRIGLRAGLLYGDRDRHGRRA